MLSTKIISFYLINILVNDLTTNIIEITKNIAAQIICATGLVSVNASSSANKPNNVVNLIIGFKATEEVSLKGSPTVSPTTVAL